MNRDVLKKVFPVLLAIILPGAMTARADFAYNLDQLFSGFAPGGDQPWLTASFVDQPDGSVTLTMSAANLISTEFVAGLNGNQGWYFNFDPALVLDGLTFTPVDDGGVPAANIFRGQDAYRADGDGYYDIVFAWSNSGGSGPLYAGAFATYSIAYSGAGQFSSDSFRFSSAAGPGSGPEHYYSAAHVQGIIYGENETSGWIGGLVPAPAAVLLGVIGLGLVGWMRRRLNQPVGNRR